MTDEKPSSAFDDGVVGNDGDLPAYTTRPSAKPTLDRTSVLDEVSATVPIVAPPTGDGEPVEIRLDDDKIDETMAASSEQNLTADRQDVASVLVPSKASLWTTPAQSARTIFPGARSHGWQVLLEAKETQSEQSKPDGQSLASTTALTSPQSSQSSSKPEGAPSSDEKVQPQPLIAHPPLTQRDLLDSIPHPDAIFHTEDLQWRVVLSEDEMRKGYVIPTFSHEQPPISGPAPLWRCQGRETLQGGEGDMQIASLLPRSATDKTMKAVSDFDRWTSTEGSNAFLSTAGSVPSVVPTEHLRTFQRVRVESPRAGLSGAVTLTESIQMLIKIIGNAANGKMNPLTTTGRGISVKLGLDAPVIAILSSLGFRRTESPSSPQINPPDMTSPEWQVKMRRAYIELSLWARHEVQIPNGTENINITSDVPFHVRSQSCLSYLERVFGYSDSQISADYKNAMSSADAHALQEIGADESVTDELLDYAYRLNCLGRTFIDRIVLFSALKESVDSQRSDSDILQTTVAMEKSEGLFTFRELREAYKLVLGTDLDSFEAMRDVDESFLVDFYLTAAKQVASQPSKVQDVKDALAMVSASRGHPSGLSSLVNMPIELEVNEAYEILGVNHDTDDDFIGSAYQIAAVDSKYTAEQCNEALRVIGLKRNSQALKKIYRQATGNEGEDDFWTVDDSSRPAGLNNIGNTCYLNSVLQYFYAIQPLRQRVLEAGMASTSANPTLTADELKFDTTNVSVGGRKVTQREVDRSHRFVGLLAQLFGAMMTSPATAVTPERDLAYLALVSSRVEEEQDKSLNVIEEGNDKAESSAGQIVKPEQSDHSTSTATETTLVDEPLPISTSEDHAFTAAQDRQASFASSSLQANVENVPPSLPPRPKENLNKEHAEVGLRRNSLMQLGAQQDVSECLDNVMFQVEVALTAGHDGDKDGELAKSDAKAPAEAEPQDDWIPDADLLRRLFLGRTNQRLEVEDGQKSGGYSVHTKQEVFKILPIEVLEEGRDIYDGLDGFFDEEILTDTGGQPIRRTVTLTDAPAIMQIQLQRVQFDRVRGVYKSQAHLAMGETLYMDRYMDFDASSEEDRERLQKRKTGHETRQQIARLRRRIQRLRLDSNSNKIPVARSLDKSAHFLASLQNTTSPLRARREGPGSSDEAEGKEGGVSDPAVLGGGIPSSTFDVGFNQFLEEESKRVEREIQEAEEKIKQLKAYVETLWSQERRSKYVLASVFMHRGEASHGHYFLNQRKLGPSDLNADETEASSAPATWFKYNDNVVEEITLDQVLKDTTGATPYLLSYVRQDLQHSIGLFDTVCRQIDFGAPPTTTASTAPPQNDAEAKDAADTLSGDVKMADDNTDKSIAADAMDTS